MYLLKLKQVFIKKSNELFLENISFAIDAGDVAIISGPIGSNTSFLFDLICGFLKPHKGFITLSGKIINELSVEERRQKGLIGISDYYKFPNLKGGDILDYGSFLKNGFSIKKLFNAPQNIIKTNTALQKVLKAFQMNVNFLSKKFFKMTFKEKFVIRILFLLFQEPKVLVLEKMLTDIEMTKEEMEVFFAGIRFLAKEYGIAIIFVDKKVEKYKNYLDKVLILKEHGVFFFGKTEDLKV